MDYSQLDKELNRILGLDRPAVAIKFLTEEKNLKSYDTSKQYTFCQFIMKAREGQKLMATGDNIACANGASALGFKLVPEKIINGDFWPVWLPLPRKAPGKPCRPCPGLNSTVIQLLLYLPFLM